MSRSKRRVRAKRDVNPFLEKLIIAFFTIPWFPVILGLSGQDEGLHGDEIPGLLALAVGSWGVAGVAAWRAGGLDYLVESVCFALLITPMLPWMLVPLAGEAAPRGGDLQRLVVATALLWGLVALLAWRFELWPFENREARTARHPVAVFHADPPEKDYPPYYIAICECGWMGDAQDLEERAFADAHKHSPNVDPGIERPLDPDYRPEPRA